jgi:hypothetical protein
MGSTRLPRGSPVLVEFFFTANRLAHAGGGRQPIRRQRACANRTSSAPAASRVRYFVSRNDSMNARTSARDSVPNGPTYTA